ncbi:MAG: hypothetical protein IT423_16460 [Pirellulaceae bacterium]|nr:hypothetical protein [Pirellulaceae bacterium]
MPANPAQPTALSWEEWKKLPIPEKHDEAAYDRLRLGNPQLKSDKAWRVFMIKEVIPERKRDIPPTMN